MLSSYTINNEELRDALTTWLKNHNGIRINGAVDLKWISADTGDEIDTSSIVPVLSFDDKDAD